MRQSSALFLSLALLGFTQVCTAQQAAGTGGCSLPVPPLDINRPNIFSVEQEQWLGQAEANELEADYDLIPEKESAELERIGQKLLAQLPPTPIHYHFRVYEAEDANAFSIAGGYVYVSRKLITDARSEDEIAGVMAHEIGHIYTKQLAAAYTRELKARMGVTSLGDREDVDDKLQLLLNVPWKQSAGETEGEEDKDELVADKVGLYALTKAGYAPKAFSESLDRVGNNKGRTGNFLTDILGGTDLISLRVRVARKIAETIPPECGSRVAASSPEFKTFQDAVRNAPVHPLIDATPGLNSIKLDPPMRNQLDQVHFSPNGQYLFAQDESVIHVLSRSPLKLLFTIPAVGAQPAHFTPDSSHIVFHFSTLRVEKWDIATAKRESFKELVDYDGCLQTSLTPDGNIFVCLAQSDQGPWLKLTEVETGKRLYENKYFHLPGSYAPSEMVVRRGSGTRVATVSYSQDGHTMLIVSGSKTLAFDLVNKKPMELGPSLVHFSEGRTAFVDSDKLLYECNDEYKGDKSTDTFKLCESTFPDGLAINSFKVGFQWVEPVAHGNSVLIGPFKDNAAVLIDPSTGKASAGFKLDSLDIFDHTLVGENENGGLTVSELGGQHVESVDLPASPMRGIESGSFSADGKFLAFSGRSRSSIWDLTTQKRVSLMRPFRDLRIDGDNQMFAQYQQAHQRPGQNYRIDLTTGKAAAGPPYSIDQFQYGNVLITFQPGDKSGDVRSNVTMQVADISTGAPLWSKHFAQNRPTIWQTNDGELVYQMWVNSDTAISEMKHAGVKLIKTSDWKNEWVSLGMLIEVVDSRTGEVRRAVQAPQTRSTWSREDARWVSVFGDYLVVHGNQNNSTIYRVSDGKRLGAFYGRAIAGDAKLALVAATNRDQEITIYDLKNGKSLESVTVDHLPLTARFVAEKNTLLVLTANQRVFTLDLSAVAKTETAGAK